MNSEDRQMPFNIDIPAVLSRYDLNVRRRALDRICNSAEYGHLKMGDKEFYVVLQQLIEEERRCPPPPDKSPRSRLAKRRHTLATTSVLPNIVNFLGVGVTLTDKEMPVTSRQMRRRFSMVEMPSKRSVSPQPVYDERITTPIIHSTKLALNKDLIDDIDVLDQEAVTPSFSTSISTDPGVDSDTVFPLSPFSTPTYPKPTLSRIVGIPLAPRSSPKNYDAYRMH
ncbi:hypothetical protein PCE1_002833 [Barthelona sp. PCE]